MIGRLRGVAPTLAWRILAPCAVLAALLGGNFVVLASALDDARDAQRANERSNDALAQVYKTEKLLVDVQTGARGYLLSGKEEFLEPLKTGRRDFPVAVGTLEGLVIDRPADARLVRVLAASGQAFIDDYTVPLVALGRRDRPAAVRIVAQGEGKRRLDAIRADFERLIVSERDYADERSAHAGDAFRTVLMLSLGGLALSVALLGLFAAYVARAISAPLGRITAAVARVGEGDLSARAPADGPRELVVLGESFNEMTASLESGRQKLETRNAELQLAQAEAQRANRAKSEFLSRMSHELRTPLNSILGFGQLLEMSDLPAKQRGHVDYIVSGGRHLLELINEVLDIARIEAGSMEISLESVRPADTIEAAVAMVAPLAAARGIVIERELVPGELTVRADSQRLKQVMLNLLSNAIKYNRPGGRVTIGCEPCDRRLSLRVTDTGPGLDASQLERLFTPFDRLGVDEDEIEGTGLGLPLSQRLVELMDGSLRVESELGVGTTFFVELELDLAAGTASAADAAGPYDLPADVPSPGVGLVPGEAAVLYVEDNVNNLRLVEELVGQRLGMPVHAALNGATALEQARRHRPALILLDLHLPDIDGEEVLRRLRADAATRRIPVVVLSADATPGRIERLLESGASAYLTKPLDVVRFLMLVDQLLAEREAVAA